MASVFELGVQSGSDCSAALDTMLERIEARLEGATSDRSMFEMSVDEIEEILGVHRDPEPEDPSLRVQGEVDEVRDARIFEGPNRRRGYFMLAVFVLGIAGAIAAATMLLG